MPDDNLQDPTRTSHVGAARTSRPAGGPAPLTVGEYAILGRLGEGGMGTVYEAEQQNPKRRVAVKVVHGGAYVISRSLAASSSLRCFGCPMAKLLSGEVPLTLYTPGEAIHQPCEGGVGVGWGGGR